MIVKRFGVKKIGENAIVKLNEAINPPPPPPKPPPPPPPRMERGVITEVTPIG